ncbi:MAG: LAGLIDADG family homing endonuclease [Patescibacteria group bacterium]|jgi:DNA-binding transcriptional regulator WhiA
MNKKVLNSNKELQAYIIGIALGDGNLSNPNGRATRLRIFCDTKYPFLIKKISKSLQKLLPSNKVSTSYSKFENCATISCYSNYWPKLLGWQAKEGSKFKQKVFIPNWIRENKQYTINYIRGLIETDGSIYLDRKYKTMMFVSNISNLANDFFKCVISLNYKPRFYKIKQDNKAIYHIRLCKKIDEFLNLVKPEKR